MARGLISVAAVAAGSACWTALWIAFHAVLCGLYPRTLGSGAPIESVPLLLFFLAASVAISSAAGYLTALFARRREVPHAAALGIAQLAVGGLFQAANWELLPLWYHALFLLLLPPGHLLGGRLRAAERAQALEWE